MPRHVTRRVTAAGLAVAVCLTGSVLASGPVAAQTPTQAPTQPSPAQLQAAVEDYCGDQCRDILTPGQNGNATLVEILSHQIFGTRPSFYDTQRPRYDDLLHDYPRLTDANIDNYFVDASFGVARRDIGREYRPRNDVTVVRDRHHGIPHVYGSTRSGTMFGAGYVAAEDRLFLMDTLRNLGRGQVTSFAGGAESNRELEQDLWRGAPYTEEEKQAQIDRVATSGGERGAQALEDVDSYLDGINHYIDRSQQRRDYPGEYVLTGHKDSITQAGEIEHFSQTDLVGMASMIGLLFGGGGGGEVESALVRAGFIDQYGPEEGEEVWQTWRMENDPETVTTADGEFPYTQTPDDPVGEALPDPGSVVPYDIVHNPTGSAATGTRAQPVPLAAEDDGDDGDSENAPTVDDLSEEQLAQVEELVDEGDLSDVEGALNSGVLPGDLLDGTTGMSNALVVSGDHTASGNPISVAGPQTGYFSPQLLMVQELQGPGISARGASFAGLSFYVQIGRGVDYSWSPTSAWQDITDTFAAELCEPDGSTPTVDSRHYVDHDGTCTAFDELSVDNEWKPTVADQTPAGSYTLTALRSSYGLINSFGTVDGTPVAFAERRSTYMREVDSIIGFQRFNDPDDIGSATDFQAAAMDISYAFNWHYNDADDIAYFNSGSNPERLPGTNPNLPIHADSAAGWAGWEPETNAADYIPFEEHPQALNQPYLMNWNNKSADGFTAGGYGMGSVHRGDLLDARLSAMVADGHEFTPASLTQVMAEAGAVDLRAEHVLPELLRVLDSAPISDPSARNAVDRLSAWHEGGSQRREARKSAGTYQYAEAIRIMDAWWPLLVEEQFGPALGDDLFEQIAGVVDIAETPYGDGQHKGSAFQYGWWSYVDKDLRAVLGDDVEAPLGDAYCGGGDLADCHAMLESTLAEATTVPANQIYPGDADCAAGNQLCADTIIHSPLGGITVRPIAWQNRPTYQLVHQFPERRE